MGQDQKFTPRQWVTLFVISCVHFFSAICISLQAPFYPGEAEKKGATASEYGLVFGVFELVSFLSSPLYGKYRFSYCFKVETILRVHNDHVLQSWIAYRWPKQNQIHIFGARCMLSLGILIMSISSIFFGLLDLVMSHNWFISLSFIVRIIESLGATAALIAAFSLTAACFPDSVATTFATLEIFYGLGYIFGPTLGSLLFDIGGFQLPFIMLGIVTSVVGITIYLVLPTYVEEDNMRSNKITLWSMLRIPAVFLDSVSITAVSISIGFYAATLEPHIREFNLAPVHVGLIFIISGGTYAVIAPLVGRICDKLVDPKKCIIVGCLLIVISFSLVGPAPYLQVPKTLTFCIIGLVVHGFGLAAIMVPTFVDAIRSAVEAGFADDITTFGVLSGLWSSAFSLGAFVGPSVAGILYDLVGFSNGTLFVIAIHSTLFIVMIAFVWTRDSRRRKFIKLKLYYDEPSTSSEEELTLESESLNAKKSSCINLVAQWNHETKCAVSANGSLKNMNGYGSIIKVHNGNVSVM